MTDPATPPQSTGMPDQVETDPAALSSAEDLDEDRLGVDPLEQGVEPPERWAEADKPGMTPYEQQHGEDLDHRLAEERADVDEADAAERPVVGTPDVGMGEYTDEPPAEAAAAAAPEKHTDADQVGQSADDAGGSVAKTVRQPNEPSD